MTGWRCTGLLWEAPECSGDIPAPTGTSWPGPEPSPEGTAAARCPLPHPAWATGACASLSKNLLPSSVPGLDSQPLLLPWAPSSQPFWDMGHAQVLSSAHWSTQHPTPSTSTTPAAHLHSPAQGCCPTNKNKFFQPQRQLQNSDLGSSRRTSATCIKKPSKMEKEQEKISHERNLILQEKRVHA